MKAFAIIPLSGTSPDFNGLSYNGYVLCAQIAGYGAYLVSGTGVQLSAINALPNIIGIVSVTESNDVKWPELDNIISVAVRTKLNTWLTNRGWPTIPDGWTYKRVIKEIFTRFNERFDLNVFDVKDV